MRRMLSLTLVCAVLFGMAPLLTACNTMAGAGQDMSAAGHKLTGSAERNK